MRLTIYLEQRVLRQAAPLKESDSLSTSDEAIMVRIGDPKPVVK